MACTSQFLRSLLVSLALVALAGCGANDAPDQDQFLTMPEIVTTNYWYEDAFVRLYKEPIPNATTFTHPWLVLKRPFSDKLIVVEVRETKGSLEDYCDPLDADSLDYYSRQDCGHVYMRSGSPGSVETAYYTSDIGYIMAELRGPEAEAVVEFALTQSRDYKCRHQYTYIGVNSNTYIRWILESSGWNAYMGTSSWGQQFWKQCVNDTADETPLMLAATPAD